MLVRLRCCPVHVCVLLLLGAKEPSPGDPTPWSTHGWTCFWRRFDPYTWSQRCWPSGCAWGSWVTTGDYSRTSLQSHPTVKIFDSQIFGPPTIAFFTNASVYSPCFQRVCRWKRMDKILLSKCLVKSNPWLMTSVGTLQYNTNYPN